MVSVSSHIDLKNRVSDFWHMRLLFFYKRIKFEKGQKNRTAREKKRHNFLMRKIIKIRKHLLVSQFGKCTYKSPIFCFRETEKLKFGGIRVL